MIRFRRVWEGARDRLVRWQAQARYVVAIKVLRPYRFTKGFEDFDEFDSHYPRHGREHSLFGKTAYSYARFADSFCGAPIADPNVILEHVKRDGTRVRCNPQARIVGVLHANNIIGTCHV